MSDDQLDSRQLAILDDLNRRIKTLESAYQAIGTQNEQALRQLIHEVVDEAIKAQSNNVGIIINERFEFNKKQMNEAFENDIKDLLEKLEEKEKSYQKLTEEKMINTVTELIQKQFTVYDTYFDPISEQIRASENDILSKVEKLVERIESLEKIIANQPRNSTRQKELDLSRLPRLNSGRSSRNEDALDDETPRELSPTYSTIYFAEPPQKGYFSKLHPEYSPQITLFKIMLEDINDREAAYTLVEREENVQFIFNFTDSLRGAIEFLGIGTPQDFSKIKIQAGKVVKDEDFWKVLHKLKITWN